MKIQHLNPAVAAAVRALDERAERAAAERDAFRSEITPAGAKLVKKPDGSCLFVWPAPEEESGATP